MSPTRDTCPQARLRYSGPAAKILCRTSVAREDRHELPGHGVIRSQARRAECMHRTHLVSAIARRPMVGFFVMRWNCSDEHAQFRAVRIGLKLLPAPARQCPRARLRRASS